MVSPTDVKLSHHVTDIINLCRTDPEAAHAKADDLMYMLVMAHGDDVARDLATRLKDAGAFRWCA